MSDDRSTLVGLATGRPDGPVAVVRLSGPGVWAILGRLGIAGRPAPRRASVRALELGDGARETAVLTWFDGPGSFTGEDCVELGVHGGRTAELVVDALVRAGAEPAGPGAFSRRAFELGRWRLDELEGFAALVTARTEQALAAARRLAAGQLGDRVEGLASRLLAARAEVEARLDFADDVAEDGLEAVRGELQALVDELARAIAGVAASGRAWLPPRVVIAGPPNAGKSALFNALLGHERSIVSAHAGTTRDWVEQAWRVEGGLEVVLVDTAGLRSTRDAIEQLGVAHSRRQIAASQLVIWAEAADAPAADPPDVGLDLAAGPAVLWVETKLDLGRTRPGWVGVSAKTGAGLETLAAAVAARLGDPGGDGWVGLERHRQALVRAQEAAARAWALLARGAEALELVGFELASAERALTELTGRGAQGPVGAAILEQVFSRFCIGK